MLHKPPPDDFQSFCLLFTLNAAKAGGLHSQSAEGEAVVHYCDPSAIRDLESAIDVENAGGLQSQGGEGEAVVHYCDPSTTQDMEPSGIFNYLVVTTGHAPFKMTYWAVEPNNNFWVRDFFSMPR